MLKLPARYESVSRLGQGGGGEVWAVRDRARDVRCAFKVLAAGAGDAELKALVREATALSGGRRAIRAIGSSRSPTRPSSSPRSIAQGCCTATSSPRT